ncbi:glycosyltransferase family 4 protein [Terrabacter sp. MAHUQ-38]|uniref:glycosyltransferase family 4 protein n=1 Tax=unclassified Terrabacter TaxID=2630222 RepID=UPI001CAA7116
MPRPLRIAVIAPPYFSVPPDGYGGVEAVVAGIVDTLVSRGHHVTLVAAGRNGTRAQAFVQTWPDPPAHLLGGSTGEVINAARVLAGLRLDGVDLVHDHTLAGPLLAASRRVPTVVTVHGPVDELADVYRPLGRAVQLVAISRSQMEQAPELNWVGAVPNGIDVDSFPFRSRKDDYVLFLGRHHPHKAPHLAIDAAKAAGLRILLAGKCEERHEQEYYEREIRPRLGDDVVDVGVADAAQKRRLLAGARCLVFPVCWDEPFGLVMTEAMACGTPVVAFARGAVPEVVAHGRTGFVVDRPHELAPAILRTGELDAAECRAWVGEHFSLDVMGRGYERVYRTVLGAGVTASVPGRPLAGGSA